jgi:hypothetical protein
MTMNQYTINLTDKQAAGLAAAVAEFNAAQPEGVAPMTAAGYIAQRAAGLCDQYADAHECGAIPVGQFVRRLTGAEIDALKARAATDANVAGFMNALDTAPKGKVWLYSDLIAQAKAYLVAIGIITADRAAVIFAIA